MRLVYNCSSTKYKTYRLEIVMQEYNLWARGGGFRWATITWANFDSRLKIPFMDNIVIDGYQYKYFS